MQVVNKKMCVVVILILVIIEACTLFLMYKSYSNQENQLDEVNLNISNSNMFAIMLEQEDGTYKEDTSNTWPKNMKFNSELSGCIDINGNKISNSLKYENGIATVDTGNTSYCYLYFDALPANEFLLSNVSSEILWDSTLEDDGYRYVGTNPNNHICFGTTVKSECVGNTDLYMYRIIGIFEDSDGKEHLKLIKKEALNETYVWEEDYNTDIDWEESGLYKGINGSYFLMNTTYSYMQSTTWLNKIKTWDYIATNTKTKENTGINYYYNSVKTIYLHEMNRSTKFDETCYYDASKIVDCSIGVWKKLVGKISLIYGNDYLLSLGNSVLEYKSSSNHYLLSDGWLHLSNNDSGAPSSDEWTMTRSGNNSGFGGSGYQAYFIGNSGGYEKVNVAYANYSVRPVFYLESSVKILGGNGDVDDPFIIK